MVEGLDRFGEHFAAYTDQYVLIGGAACTLAMDEAGQPFRATKDLDIVLCLESLDARFVESFWEFLRGGDYRIQEKTSGEKQFYRFQQPANEGYPFMLELFTRAPDAFRLNDETHLTPIPIEADVSSLSAILLDGDYYSFLQSGNPLLLHDRARRDTNFERIPPGLPAWRTPSHLLPVGIKVPCAEVARFDLRTPSRIPLRPHSRSTLSPRGGRAKANQPAPVVMNGGVCRVEFHIETEEELIVAVPLLLVLQTAVKTPSVSVSVGSSGHPGKKQRPLPAGQAGGIVLVNSLAFVVVTVCGIVMYHNTVAACRGEALVAHSYAVREDTRELLSSVKDTEIDEARRWIEA